MHTKDLYHKKIEKKTKINNNKINFFLKKRKSPGITF